MVAIMKLYFIIMIIVMLVYMVRHIIFTYNRLYSQQRLSYRDIYDSDLPKITVLLPMHNEGRVITMLFDALLKCDYDWDKLEIIAIDDHSIDATGQIIDQYSSKYPIIRTLHRTDPDQRRGKPVALNEGMVMSTGEIMIVFDADYRPSKNLLKKLATAFNDPQVGAVMGRVIPLNASKNTLTNLLNLERTGGYQVDQQARYNMRLLPQYGGTVGAFRKSLILHGGGFDEHILAEDTELTYRFALDGWHIVYDNSAECYEEAPESWDARGKQVRRWSRGHNEVMFRYLGKTLTVNRLSFFQRIDAVLLLLVYIVPFLLGLAFLDCIALFFLGEMDILTGWWIVLFVGAFNAWGNFAPFYEIAAGALLDGMKDELLVLPAMCFSFYFYMWHISLGFFDAVVDTITQRHVEWVKTDRFFESDPDETENPT